MIDYDADFEQWKRERPQKDKEAIANVDIRILTPKMAEIITMKRQGYSYGKIAMKQHSARSTVIQSMYRAIKRYEKSIGIYGIKDD